MKVNLNELSKLKQELKKLNLTNVNQLKTVPDRWEDFARLTKIKTKHGFVSFEPYQYQIDFVNVANQCPMTSVIKTRQLGYSICVVNWLIWKALLEPGIDCVVFSLNQSSTSQLAKQARSQLDSLQDYCEMIGDSLTSISFANGSNIYFRNSSIDASRGLTVKYAVFDESGFIVHYEELYGAVTPCLTIYGDAGRIVNISTPNLSSGFAFDLLNQNNGDRNLLDICENIRANQQGSTSWIDIQGNGKVVTHWCDNPSIKDKSTYLERIAKRFNLDRETVEREYNLSFESSVESVFNPILIRDTCVGPLSKKSVEKARVFFGIDPNASSGSNADYFCISIFQELNQKIELIDYYRNRGVTSDTHIYEVGKLIKKYKPAVITVESNNSGNVYVERLTQAYPHQHIEKVHTSSPSKETMISRLIMAMDSKILKLPDDKTLIAEMLSFQKVGGKMEAVGRNATDDLVMAIAIALTQSDIANPDKSRFSL